MAIKSAGYYVSQFAALNPVPLIVGEEDATVRSTGDPVRHTTPFGDFHEPFSAVVDAENAPPVSAWVDIAGIGPKKASIQPKPQIVFPVHGQAKSVFVPALR